MTRRTHKCKKGARWDSEREACVRRVKRGGRKSYSVRREVSAYESEISTDKRKRYSGAIDTAKSWLSKRTIVKAVPNYIFAAAGAAAAGYLAYNAFAGDDSVTTPVDNAFQATSDNVDAFKGAISADAQPYADIILRVAAEQGISPAIISAIGDQESHWGRALTPQGPTGTGDGGHGCGLMQIDDRTWGDWLAANDWTDPYTHITKAVQIYKAGLDYFTATPSTPTVSLSASQAATRGVAAGTYPDVRPLADGPLQDAAIAAYNTGNLNVLRSLAVGLPAETTTTNTAGYPGTSIAPGIYVSSIAKYLDPVASAIS